VRFDVHMAVTMKGVFWDLVEVEVEVEVNLRPTVGQLSWCQVPIWDPQPLYLSS
jgi:hypothetical protein